MGWLPPPIETRRLRLRSLAAEPGEEPASLARLQDLTGLPSNWSLIDRETGVVIGTVGFIRWDRDEGSAELGFMIAPSRRRSGLMSEAILAVLAFGFGPLKLSEITAFVQPDNTASIRILDKLGFLPGETVLRPLHSHGDPQTLIVYRAHPPG